MERGDTAGLDRVGDGKDPSVRRAVTLSDRYLAPVVQPTIDRHRLFPGAGWMMELRQPAGDYAAPATAELLLVEAVTPGISLRKVWGAARFDGVAAAGSLWLVPSGAAIDLTVRAAHTVRTLAVAAPVLARGLDDRTPLPPLDRLAAAPFLDDHVTAVLGRLWQAAGSDAPAPDTALRVDELLQQLLARLAQREGQPPAPFRGGLTARQVATVTSRIEAAGEQAVSLAELAATCDLSPFHFARAFKQTIGVSPYRFQKLRRLQRARDLLADGRRSVLEVALAVGYDSAQAMARVFRRELGVSPSRFQAARRY